MLVAVTATVWSLVMVTESCDRAEATEYPSLAADAASSAIAQETPVGIFGEDAAVPSPETVRVPCTSPSQV